MGLSCGPPVSSQLAVTLTTATRVRRNNKTALQPKRTRMVATLLKKRRVEVAVSSAEHSSLRLTIVTGSHMLAPRIVLRYLQRPVTFHITCPLPYAASCSLPSRSFTINISLGHSACTMCSSRSLAASSIDYRDILSSYIIYLYGLTVLHLRNS